MSEKKGAPAIAVNPNKLAMSRALGAAFLNHQVEQLEKSVNSSNNGYAHGAAPTAGSWRHKGRPPSSSSPPGGAQPPMPVKRPPMAPGIKVASKGGNAKEDSQAARKARAASGANVATLQPVGIKSEAQSPASAKGNIAPGRRSSEVERDEKDADIVVVDASVLINALYQVKKWCRDGRREILIVPLEALNTLDLLKKGTNTLAQRARAASRILEAQVGTNPRIRVQQDDAFVLWDKIAFSDEDNNVDSNILRPNHHPLSPEWLRRTICCARWEIENAATTVTAAAHKGPASPAKNQIQPKQPRVILAVLSPPVAETSPRVQNLKLSDSPPQQQTLLNPVPLPGPSHSLPGSTPRLEPRSSGVLVAYWAAKAGIKLLEVEQTRQGMGGIAEDEARGKRAHGGAVGRGRRHSNAEGTGPAGGAAIGVSLVERPPAVRAMMEMVAQQPSATRVVRVLARGEKLDPDP